MLPEDNWDQECTFEMMPITTPVHPDAKAKGMMAVGRRAAVRQPQDPDRRAVQDLDHVEL